jgi:serine phosphatase RsbU (regulator of sigma subunit)
MVGIGDVESGAITVANAGHPEPLIVDRDSAAYAATAVGLPLGVAPTSYAPTTIQLTSGSTFVAFTDGLVERRGESIDVGKGRMARAATGPYRPVDDLLSRLTDTLEREGPRDDVAVLAFRWTRPS